jgi:GNAT superfamily N-acetyltransferase
MSANGNKAHLNLVESSRRLFELDPGATIEAERGWLFGAGRSPHPVISNAAFRIDDQLEPAEFLNRAREFFGNLERGFSVWVRGQEPEDRDLAAAAEDSGLRSIYEMPEMVLGRRAEERPLPSGIQLRQLAGASEAEDFWRVAKSAYTSIGFPPEVFAFYEEHAGLIADDAAAFIAYKDGRPLATAMTIVSHGVAGIYWVATMEEARKTGLGWVVTSAAVNAGFDRGAEIASLQASPMGESLYSAMGFETLFRYRALMASPPDPAADGDA